ncbi:MAG: GFA family protein [Pseudomonadota bacterium]
MAKERKLAAILISDVVGYSRLMGSDETATLRDMQEHQISLINPLIGQYHGRVVKLMGDGMLVEFQSATEAVKCAISIQRGMISRNENVPETSQIRLRIGINVGEIIVDGEDIYGDGVNIASRLQEQAAPDGVCISSTVFGQIDGHVDHTFEDIGAHQFKNIAKAIRLYHFNPDPSQSKAKVAFRPFVDIPVNEEPVATGGCLCGNIRYEVTGKSMGSMLCHCRMCQRFSGAPILEGTTFPKDNMRFIKGEPKYYQSSNIAKRGFCGECGSPVTYEGIIGDWTNWVVITTGSFDEPWKFPPTYHLGTESSLPWLVIVDDLPRTKCGDSPSLVEAYRFVGEDVP